MDFPTLDKCYEDVGPGWKPILESLNAYVLHIARNSSVPTKITVSTVKEKFGELRVFFAAMEGLTDREADEILAAADMASILSRRLCEECSSVEGVETRGANNSPYGWLKTYCKEHHDARDAVRPK